MLEVKIVCMCALIKLGMCVGPSSHYLKIQAITVPRSKPGLVRQQSKHMFKEVTWASSRIRM